MMTKLAAVILSLAVAVSAQQISFTPPSPTFNSRHLNTMTAVMHSSTPQIAAPDNRLRNALIGASVVTVSTLVIRKLVKRHKQAGVKLAKVD